MPRKQTVSSSRGGSRHNDQVKMEEVEHHDHDDIPNEENLHPNDPSTTSSSSARRRHHHHHHKNKFVPVMSASGQTDEERRQLRHLQRELRKNITSTDVGHDMEDPSKQTFDSVRTKNNMLWNQVRFTREAVLDGENIDLISGRAARQVDKLIQVPRYDASRLIQKLRQKCTIREMGDSTAIFDWRRLGIEVGACYNSVPSRISFLTGPIDAHYTPKERKKPERRKRSEEDDEEAEEEKPEEVDQTKKSRSNNNEDKPSAVERHIKVVSSTLERRCREEEKERKLELHAKEASNAFANDEEKIRANKRFKRHGRDVDAIKYLFNPQSFTQTVENIFYFSFLVKKGDASIQVRNEKESREYGGPGPGPVVTSKVDSREGPQPEAQQAVISLNMRDWKDLCKAFNVDKGDIPHRSAGSKTQHTGTKRARPQSSQVS